MNADEAGDRKKGVMMKPAVSMVNRASALRADTPEKFQEW